MSSETSDNLALLIDGENVSHRIIDGLMIEIAKYGTASVRRIYADFTDPARSGWKDCLLRHSLIPMQQYAYTSGKNSTDGAMIIDAMDLLYTGRFKAFCIVSSDSDFTRLAARIREQGVTVYGFGERKTNYAFIAACSRFVYFDVLNMTFGETKGKGTIISDLPVRSKPVAEDQRSDSRPPPPRASTSQPTAQRLDRRAIDGLAEAIMNCLGPDHEYANLAKVGHYLSRISPDLNARNLGFLNLREFIEATGIADMKMEQTPNGPPVAYVRLKDMSSGTPDGLPNILCQARE